MKYPTKLMAGLLICAAMLISTPAQSRDYDYDFDDLDPNFFPYYGGSGYLEDANNVKQDNWDSWYQPYSEVYAQYCLRVAEAPMGGAPDPGANLCVTMPGGAHPQWAARVNDANWSFNLDTDDDYPGQPSTARLADRFTLQVSMAIDYDVSASYGYAKFGVSGSGKELLFGLNVEEWYYGICIWDAQGTKHVVNLGAARNDVWDFRMVVTPSANGDEGAGSLYAMKRGTHTEWQTIAGLQDINLKLDTAGMNIFTTNALTLRLNTRIAAYDNLHVYTPIRGDANLDDLVDGQDFTFLKANFGSSGMSWTDADFNGDGLVDGVDFTYLKAHYGENQQYTPPTAPAGVPDPATMLLLAAGAAGLALRRRR